VKKLVLVVACAVACSLVAPPSAQAATEPAAEPTAVSCEKQLRTTNNFDFTIPYNTPGAPVFMQMTATSSICWSGDALVPSLVASDLQCRMLVNGTARRGRVEVVATGVGGDAHAIKVQLTCRVRIPNFRGHYSVYKVREFQTLSLGAWLKKPYVVNTSHQHIQVR